MMRSGWKYVGIALPVAVLALVSFSSVTVAQDHAKKTDTAAGKDIVATAMADKNFSTLCKLLDKAGLVETLKGPGPFTVFAPTDEAFKKLGEATLNDLMKPESETKLKGILKYHVVSGKVMAADVTKMKTAKTLNGEATITTKDKDVMIDHAKITKTDIACSNGVIHVIDTVLMPKEGEKKHE